MYYNWFYFSKYVMKYSIYLCISHDSLPNLNVKVPHIFNILYIYSHPPFCYCFTQRIQHVAVVVVAENKHIMQ